MNLGLLSQEELDESLSVQRATGKPLGQVLVEKGFVPAHSIAMALADQHGGPLKTEFGFATGHPGRGTPDLPGKALDDPPQLLQLAPTGVAPDPVSNPAARPVDRDAPPRPTASALAPPTVTDTPPPPITPEPLATRTAGLPVQPEAETAAHVSAESRANELLARIRELQAELHAAGPRAAEEAAAPLRAQLEELRIRLDAQTARVAAADAKLAGLRDQLATERATNEQAIKAAEALRAQLEELRARDEATAAADSVAGVDELRAVIELQEQALAAASARERARDGDARVADPASTRSYSEEGHFLFAPSADGYELLQRSGPSPSPGSLVELSGGRTCRVMRLGPAPFPGSREACAYLEIV